MTDKKLMMAGLMSGLAVGQNAAYANLCEQNPEVVETVVNNITKCDYAIVDGTSNQNYISHTKKLMREKVNSVCDRCYYEVRLESCLTEGLYRNYTLRDLNIPSPCN